MKKWFTAVCAVAMLTSACTGLTACKDENITLTMQEIYNANTTATLQASYEKLGIVKTNALDGTVVRTYLDGEVYYESTTKDQVVSSVCYDKEGTVGYVFEGGAYFGLLTTPEQLQAKPTQAYISQVFEDKAMMLAEEVVSAVKKKDGVYVQTKHNAENSSVVALRDGYTCADGEYVQTDYVLDAETYRVLSLERKIITSAEPLQYFKIEQKTNVMVTDTEYSADLVSIITSVKALKNEENGDNVWTMHVEANSNTPNEKDWKAVALTEHGFKIDLGKSYAQIYRDVELETEYVPAETDKTDGYIKLYAKRTFIPEEYGFTWQDVLSANATNVLLNKYDSITVTTTYEGDENKSVTYVDDKMVYNGYAETSTCYLMDGTRGYTKSGESYSVIVDRETDMQARVQTKYETAVFNSVWREKETIDSAEKRGGKYYITTILTKAEYEELAGGITDETIEYFQKDYVIDAYSYRLYQCEAYTVYTDKAKVKESTMELTDNAETAPDGAEEMYAKMMATENVADVIVYLSVEGNWVKLFDGQRVKGDGLDIAYNYGAVQLYTDEDCTQAFEDTDKQKMHLVLYAVTGGQGE